MTQRRGWKLVGPMVNGAVTATLCGLMVVAPVVGAEETGKSAIPVAGHVAPLTQQEKVLHALNRMTFGPRPGDEAAVAKMGLDKWFELQLHPLQIDDSAFEAEMTKFPAMLLTSEDLMKRFPSPQMLRAMENRGGAMPQDPTEKAVYSDALAQYELKKKQQETGAPAGADPAMTANGQAGGAMADGTAAVGSAAADGDGSMQAAATPAESAAAGKKGKRKAALEAAGGPMDQMDAKAVLALPPDERMAKIVAMSPQEMMTFRAALKPYERAELVQGLSPAQVETVAAMEGGPVRVVGAEALETRLLRDVDSNRQLQAVMTDFWLNHFNVYIRKNQNEAYYLPEYQRDAILPHALGKFEDLLVATAKSPAMLMYLDNWQSIGPDSQAAQGVKQVQQVRPNGKIAKALPKGINENYARELMELHTLGVGGGYTQKDVIEVAKCFTGWTIDRPYQGMGQQAGFRQANARGRFRMGGRQPVPEDMATPGEFTFMANRHEPGTKTVLGHTIKEGGEDEGLQVLHILATSPATAKFVSTKLAVRFVSDNPSPALVNAMSATFLKTGGDMAAVLSTMFHSPEFWSPVVYRAKVKTPLEFMVSALRASDATVKNAVPLVQAMDRLGMPIYGMQTPNGYSWKADEWVSSNALVSRMNFALVLSGSRVPGTQTNWPALLGEGSDVAGAPTPVTEKKLEALLLGEPAAVRTRETVLAQFTNSAAVQQASESFAAAPAKGSGDDGAEMVRAAYGKRAGRGGGDAMLAAQPVTPLDTMAGLLLGSPDFQRR
jgi:uncharacterized protein (DUF1800 family)